MKILDWIQKEGGISAKFKKLSRAVCGKAKKKTLQRGGEGVQ
jgi:hypothetical protein